MKKVIKIKYDSENKKSYIYFENEFIDSSVIDGKEISQWIYPFILKNKRWNGIYEEMKELCQSEEFIVIFMGDDSDFDILNEALKDTKAELLKLNNKVVILYNDESKSVKITVNGKVFDTSKIDGSPIDKWVNPFESEDIKWKGIYSEIVNYLGINSYSIQFVGEQKYMSILMDNCPENIDITYSPPVTNKNDNENSEAKEVISDKLGSSLNNGLFSKNTAAGDNMSAMKSNKSMNSMSALKGSSAPKNTAKGMQSMNAGSAMKNSAKGMQSMNTGSAAKSNAKGMQPMNTGSATKSSKNGIQSKNNGTAQKNNANGMASIKNDALTRNNINLDESKLSVPEAGWEDTSKGLIKDIKTDIANLREYNSTLTIVGLVLCIVSAAGILLSILLMSTVVAIISSIPALVFAVWAFIENYKKLAVTVAVLDVLLAIIVCLIVFIRWRIIWGGFAFGF